MEAQAEKIVEGLDGMAIT